MKRVRLTDVISGFALKRLTPTEVDSHVSNGHEFQGVNELKRALGGKRIVAECTFVFLPRDDSTGSETLSARVSWYNCRENKAHRSPEWRLYYDGVAGTMVQALAKPGDLFALAILRNGSLVVFIAPNGSTHEGQLLSLFAFKEADQKFLAGTVEEDRSIGLTESMILESLGIDTPEPEISDTKEILDEMVSCFGEVFPSTSDFSRFALSKFCGPDPMELPDEFLVAIMEWEHALFRLFEERLIAQRLRAGFTKDSGEHDVESFIFYARSVGNRRFSRAGYAFENHLKTIFDQHAIRYSWHGATEGKRTPDFLFPGVVEYRDAGFPADALRMLGAKTSCKDRWRQIINEAARVKDKHLITLEPAISEEQTNEMSEEGITLVIPRAIQDSYTANQRSKACSLVEFIDELKSLQRSKGPL